MPVDQYYSWAGVFLWDFIVSLFFNVIVVYGINMSIPCARADKVSD